MKGIKENFFKHTGIIPDKRQKALNQVFTFYGGEEKAHNPYISTEHKKITLKKETRKKVKAQKNYL